MIDALVKIAVEYLYLDAVIKAGITFYQRQTRATHPPGEFDEDGCFWAEERTAPVTNCRAPTRKYRYPEMLAARTAAHCAEVHGTEDVTSVRRVAMALERLQEGNEDGAIRLLKKGIRKRKTEL